VWNRDERFAFAGYLVRLRLNCDRAEPRFVGAWFNTPEMKAMLRARAKPSINMSNINATEVLELSLVLPPLKEQRRIAEVLDQAEALRAKRRAALAQLDTLTQSIFLDLFGDPDRGPNEWPSVMLGDVAEIITGYPFRSQEYQGPADGVRLCRGANVMPSRLDWSDLACWPAGRTDSMADFNLVPGDIVLAMDRPWISEGFKLAEVRASDCPALLVQRVARLRGKTGVPNAFLLHILGQPAFARHCRPTETTIPHISPKEIRSFTFSFPPLALQRDFARRVAAVDKLKSAHRASLAKLDALFASLQHRAFRGTL
jgi:type I restriction enzyme S subunit